MSAFAEWLVAMRLRLRTLLHRRRLQRDLKEELQFHLAARAEKYQREGMCVREADQFSRRQFGNPTVLKEALQDMWTFRWLDVLQQDLRYAMRTLARNPGFGLVVTLTLALGIGANAAIFSVFDAVVLRPLPFPEQDRLVQLWGNVKREKVERRGTSLPDYADWRDQSHSFEAMAYFTDASFMLTGVDEPERLEGEFVAHPYAQMLGARPMIGRWFTPEEDQVPRRDAVLVLGARLWRQRFGADPQIVGRTLRLNDRDYSVVGVMNDGFRGVTDDADLWIPLHMIADAQGFANRGSRGPAVLAKLKLAVTIEQAQREMDEICKRLEQAYPATNEGRGVELSPLQQELFGNVRMPLLLLLGAVGLVLLIACTNVANLLLVRSEVRHREIAVRTALGADRWRIFRQLTTESFLLALLGATGGLLLARWGITVLLAASPARFPSYIQPALDLRVTLLAILLTCGVGTVLGLAPAIHLRGAQLNDVIKQSGRSMTGDRRGVRFRNALVVAEVAFAMLLLAGAGLLIRSLEKLSAIRLGYDPSHVLTVRVNLPRLSPPPSTVSSAPAQGDAQAVSTGRSLLARIAQIPGVEAAAAGSDSPLRGESATFYSGEGQPPTTAQNRPRAYIHLVTPGFFETLRIPFVAGRTFTESEMQDNSSAVIVSEAVVKRFWPGQDPIGKRVKLSGPDPWLNIVGVVNELRYRGIPNNATADPDFFLPRTERQRGFALLVRTRTDPSHSTAAVRQAVQEEDRGAVIFDAETMEETVARRTSVARFTSWLMGIFAGAALLLAMIGIYGVMSYAVTRRTQEIGVRVALGAGRGEVFRLITWNGMASVAWGMAAGIAGGVLLSRMIKSMLYGVAPGDPVAFAASALALTMIALAACFVPAWRAMRIAPAVALHDE